MKKNYYVSTVVWVISLSIFFYLFSGYAKPMPYGVGVGLFGILMIVLVVNLVDYIRTWIQNKQALSGGKVFIRCIFIAVNVICLIPLCIMTIFNVLCL